MNIKESYYELKCFELLLNFYFDLYVKFLKVPLACEGCCSFVIHSWVEINLSIQSKDFAQTESQTYKPDLHLPCPTLNKICTNSFYNAKKKCRKKAQVAGVWCWCTCDLGRAMTGRAPAPPASPASQSWSGLASVTSEAIYTKWTLMVSTSLNHALQCWPNTFFISFWGIYLVNCRKLLC